MRVNIPILVVCVGLASTGATSAAPRADAHVLYERAVKLDGDGEYDQAFAAIEEGLALTPKDLPILRLKGSMLLKLRNYPGALAAYQAYLDAGATGVNRLEAQRIVDNLFAVRSTSLEITTANGPATIYLDSKAYGVFCTAAPSCNQAILPGEYKVIAVRPGFKPGTELVTVPKSTARKVAITMVEKPSSLIVQVTPAHAQVMVDDAPHDASVPVAAGTHQVVVSLAGHAEVRREVTAREGQAIRLDLELRPLVPIRVEPPSAELRLDGTPITVQDGGIELPPGAHVLVARASGFHERSIEIPAARGANYMLAVQLARIQVPMVVPPVRDRWPLRRKLALVVGGAGAVAMAPGVVLGLRARQLEDRGNDLCRSTPTSCSNAQQATDLNLQARSRALQANIAYGITGVAAIAAAILWLTGTPESRHAVTPRLSGGAGFDLSGRF